MGTYSRKLTELSKGNTIELKEGEKLTYETVQLSALCRIADSLEKLTFDTEAKEKRLKALEISNNALLAENKSLKRSKAALQGHLKRKK